MVVGTGLDLRMFPSRFLLGSYALRREDPPTTVASCGDWFGRTGGSDSFSDSASSCGWRPSSARNLRGGSRHSHPSRPTRRRIPSDLRYGGANRNDRTLIRLRFHFRLVASGRGSRVTNTEVKQL